MTPAFVLLALFSVCLTNSLVARRQERQASDCPQSTGFRCDNGQCISTFNLCDGLADCDDKSDETKARCSQGSQRCPNSGFRCAYGACVDRSAVCDGKQDCADNSDEFLLECTSSNHASSPTSKCEGDLWSCDSGQCIHSFSFCDGQGDCSDGSDESVAHCINIKCTNGFQCAYGACIDSVLKCNGVSDCYDGSDESAQECGAQASPHDTPELVSCSLPAQPANGRYLVHSTKSDVSRDLLAGVPGTIVPPGVYVFLNYSCHPGYTLEKREPGSVFYSSCTHGTWTPTPPCQKLCPPLSSTSLDLTCLYLDEVVGCDAPARPDTEVHPTCKAGYALPSRGTPFHSAKCTSSGQWDHDLFSCQRVCGLRSGNVSLLISYGGSTVVGEFPWHIALYQLENGKYVYKCGGSIISQYVVLTAAHCVYNEAKRALFPAHSYKVVANKYFREFERFEGSAVRVSVREIRVPSLYHGKDTSLEGDIAVLFLSRPVYSMPICLNFQLTSEHLNGKKGVISGWGEDERGILLDELKYTEMPYIDGVVCYNISSETFKNFVRNDKFCGSYDNGGGVQQGDSGSGYMFNVDGTYFVVGITSVKPFSGDTFAVFTNVSKYSSWLMDMMEQGPPLT